MIRSNQTVVEIAQAHGFALVGFASLKPLGQRRDFYLKWLQDGNHGSMEYLARYPERRLDPRVLDPRFKSVVSLAYPYAPPPTADANSIDWRGEMRGRIAAYALGRDYHDYVLKAARNVAQTISQIWPDAITRVYVDTGPVLEREWATEARLGWFGKNTMLLNRNHGSYFFLAEIFTDVEFEPSREPYRDHCGTCRRCLELCPTGALADGYVMESRLCISYQTIENRGAIPVSLRSKLGNWIFGCDICNEVCPWNGDATSDADSHALFPSLTDLLALDDTGFSRRFTGSAIKRAKRRGLLRNVAVALGNTRNPEAVAALARSLESEKESLVRAHVAWALGQIGGPAARRHLDTARARESDDSVREEVIAARKTI
jgi:epoxyqueuosine reductase